MPKLAIRKFPREECVWSPASLLDVSICSLGLDTYVTLEFKAAELAWSQEPKLVPFGTDRHRWHVREAWGGGTCPPWDWLSPTPPLIDTTAGICTPRSPLATTPPLMTPPPPSAGSHCLPPTLLSTNGAPQSQEAPVVYADRLFISSWWWW